VPSTGSTHSVVQKLFMMRQQICDPVQHDVPQQVWPSEQASELQGGSLHVPLLQYGRSSEHSTPQRPQFRGSFSRLTQRPSQQKNPALAQSASQSGPCPPLPPAPAQGHMPSQAISTGTQTRPHAAS
jgi:hypothetical protein